MKNNIENGIALLNEIARQAAQAGDMLDLIANEQPVDHAHYAQVESERNTLCSVCRTIEIHFRMEPGQAELALKHANIALREAKESEDTRATNRAALAHFLASPRPGIEERAF